MSNIDKYIVCWRPDKSFIF